MTGWTDWGADKEWEGPYHYLYSIVIVSVFVLLLLSK